MHIQGWIYGITIAVTLTIGGVATLSLSHTFGSNITRFAYALKKGDTKVGQSTCLNLHGSRFIGCNPQSATVMENTLSQNLSPAEPLAVTMTRANGMTRLSVGLSTSVKDPSGNVALVVSATKSYGGEDALSIIDSAPMKTILPDDVSKKAHVWLGDKKTKTDWINAVRRCEEQNKLDENLARFARLQAQTGKGLGRSLAPVTPFQPKNCFLVTP